MGWTLGQIAEHNTASSCWVVINEQVYDVTLFLQEHPGGAQVILKHAGRDATTAYEPIHPPDALEKNAGLVKYLGSLENSAANASNPERKSQHKTKDEIRVEKAHRDKPPLSRILSLWDMETVARAVLPYKALAYFASAADDEITLSENTRAFSRFFFLPRIMRPVAKCDPSTMILGYRTPIPIFVSGAALARLGHPLGEINITRGIAASSIIQMVSSNASLSYGSIIAAATPSQILFFQLYKHANDKTAETRVREVEALGYKAIWLTVDAIVAGNRERDIKAPWVVEGMEQEITASQAGTEALGDTEVDMGGMAGGMVKNDDRNMTWEKTIPWLRSITKLPIVIKGIQCVADAVLAAQAGVDGILLSNHGGRQLDYSLPPIEVLYKLRQQRPDVFSKLEVYIDGGIYRGTDVVKALCLGAKAVGLGRAFLYAQSAYGEAGVTKIVHILEREILSAMRLLGASNVSELVPEMVERVDWQPIMGKL